MDTIAFSAQSPETGVTVSFEVDLTKDVSWFRTPKCSELYHAGEIEVYISEHAESAFLLAETMGGEKIPEMVKDFIMTKDATMLDALWFMPMNGWLRVEDFWVGYSVSLPSPWAPSVLVQWKAGDGFIVNGGAVGHTLQALSDALEKHLYALGNG
jgi:hypothetical protein